MAKIHYGVKNIEKRREPKKWPKFIWGKTGHLQICRSLPPIVGQHDGHTFTLQSGRSRRGPCCLVGRGRRARRCPHASLVLCWSVFCVARGATFHCAPASVSLLSWMIFIRDVQNRSGL